MQPSGFLLLQGIFNAAKLCLFLVLITFTYLFMLHFIFQLLYMMRAGRSALWTTTIAQSTVLSWDRLDRNQVCQKVLNEIPFFECNNLVFVITSQSGVPVKVPETALGNGQNRTPCWCVRKVLHVSEEANRGAINERKDLCCFCTQNITQVSSQSTGRKPKPQNTAVKDSQASQP